MPVFSSPLRFRRQAAAATPATGETAMWVGTDGLLRTKDPAGVERALSGAVYDDTGWIAPTLSNGWGQYAGWEPFGYRRINGVVYLRGLISGGTTTDGTLLFTLPTGFRPAVGTTGKHISVASSNSIGVIKVREGGEVQCGTPVNASWLSFAGVSFPADDYTPPTAFTRTMSDTTVTSGAKANAAGTTAYLRGSEVIVNVNVTLTSAMVAGDVAFTLPSGYRPPTTIFVTIDNANPDPPVATRWHVLTNGDVQLQGSTGVASGVILRGSFTIPVALTVTYAGLADTGWIVPTLAGSWVNYGGTFAPAGYRRIGGVVYLQGLVMNGSGNIFTLPVGFRPSRGTLIFDTDSNSAHARFDVLTNGQVNFVIGSNAHVSLSVASFPVDQ